MDKEAGQGGTSPAGRARRVRESFEAKVLLLEAMAVGAAPVLPGWPRTVGTLAAWHDPERGLYAWAKPNVVSPSGRNRDLRERYDRATAALKEDKDFSSGARRARRREGARDRERLLEEVIRLQAELTRSRRETARERQLKEIEQRSCRDLQTSLARLSRFPSPV